MSIRSGHAPRGMFWFCACCWNDKVAQPKLHLLRNSPGLFFLNPRFVDIFGVPDTGFWTSREKGHAYNYGFLHMWSFEGEHESCKTPSYENSEFCSVLRGLAFWTGVCFCDSSSPSVFISDKIHRRVANVKTRDGCELLFFGALNRPRAVYDCHQMTPDRRTCVSVSANVLSVLILERPGRPEMNWVQWYTLQMQLCRVWFNQF